MRLWLEVVVGNPSLRDDLITWAREIEAQLHKKMLVLVQDGKDDKARRIALEIGFYENLRKKVEKEAAERAAQKQYNNERNGR